MADAGTRYTDKAVQDMERRFRAIYREAQTDIIDKLNAQTKTLYARDAAKRAQVEAGTLSKQEYDNWLNGQVFTSRQWKDKVDSVATSLLYANQQANDIVEGKKRAVFGENATFQAYSFEHDAGMDLSFGVYDIATVTRLIKEQPELLPRKVVNGVKDKAWNRTKIANCVTQGIIQGESIQRIAERIARDTASQNMDAMVRYARTAMTGAQNAGRMEMLHEAQGMGIKVKKKWLATLDSRTRDAHRNLDGQVQEVDYPFQSDLGPIDYPGDFHAHPANVWNCFVGDTKIASDSEIVKSYKHDYSGRLFTIETSRGVKFTCTPNHPILTPHGWIGAYALNKGDNIVIASGRKFKGMGVYPNVNHIFPRIDAFHELFKKMTGEWASGLSVDFHGDKATANVEVVSKKRLLRGNRDSSAGKSLDKFGFKHAASFVLAKRHFVAGFGGIYVTFLSFMRRFGKKLSFIGGKLGHSIIHRFGTVARCNSSIFEAECDSMSGDMQLLRKRLDRFPGKITVDNIVNIQISTVSHVPVYNLQTHNEYYFVNSIIPYNDIKCNDNFAIVHNCRCTLIYEYPEYMPQNAQRRAYNDDGTGSELISDMTYQEWKAWKTNGGKVLQEAQAGPKKAVFTAASTIEQAEEYAKQFVSQYGKVSYKNVDLEYANACNSVLADIHENYDVGNLYTIQAMNTREKLWKESTAEAAYRWGNGDLFINSRYYKTQKLFGQHKEEIDGLMDTVLKNGRAFIDSGKATGAKKDYIEALLRTGRQCVSQSHDFVEGTFVHECGHMLDDKIFRKEISSALGGTNITGAQLLAESRAKYGGGISGYAISNNQEYVAESFTAWWYGEGEKCDPAIVGVFERMIKK